MAFPQSVCSNTNHLCFSTVDDGAIIDVNFTEFVYQPPEGFEKIMFDRSLL